MQKLILSINDTSVTAGMLNENYYRQFGFKHYGVDMVSRRGDRKVYGNGMGKVLATGYDNACGNIVIILYRDVYTNKTGKSQDIVMRYFHLDSINVVKNQSITKDTVIGYYGSTGKYSGTGKHLHMEADYDTKFFNYTPTITKSNFLKGTRDGAYKEDSKNFSTFNPLEVLNIKKSKPDSQSYSVKYKSTVDKYDYSLNYV